jgi:hypothetical protein
VTGIDPFPEVRTRVELGALPPREWIECAGCLEHESVGDPIDQMLWAGQHAKEHPAHDRFRTVRQSAFRIAPAGFAVSVDVQSAEDEPVCDVTVTLPSDPEWLTRFGFEPKLGSVTVTCSEPPHTGAEGDVVHCGHIFGDDGETVTGTYYWGPGYRPTSLAPPP